MRVMVCLPGDSEALSHVGETIVDEVAREVAGRAVEREAALTSGGDQLHAPQQRQLMARDGQRQIQRPRQIAHAELVMREGVHDADPHRARQHLEHLDGVLHHILGRQSGAGRRNFLAIDDSRERMSRG